MEFWLRGVDLNHRPLGYEGMDNRQPVESTGTGGSLRIPEERMGTLIGGLMGVFDSGAKKPLRSNFGEPHPRKAL